jgi:RNA polymerase sigma-70 factor (ECF subfamily)
MNNPRPKLIPLRASSAASDLTQGDDEQLMSLAAAGSRAAFAVLVERYLPRLTKFCARFVGQPEHAEELAQEILVELWVRRARYRSQGKLVVFLFTIARSRCLNRLRDEGRRRRRDLVMIRDGLATEIVAPNQLDALLAEERQRRVRAAFLALSPKLREVVLLRFDQGLEYADVARILGCSESTVRSRVYLAMGRLRDELAGGDEP